MRHHAGELRFRLHCQSKEPATDGLGNAVPGGAAWTTRFTVWAGMIPRNGGEAVIAGRLEGRQPYIVTMRSSSHTRQITADWRLVDARDQTRIFAVRTAADPDGRRQWIEILAESGIAA